jgi:hypothetical protein
MDYRKINSHIVLLLIIIIVGLTIAMLGRLIVLDKGFDAGTANLTFVIVFGICIIGYLIILGTLAQAIIPRIMRKLPERKSILPVENKASDIPDEKENSKGLELQEEIKEAVPTQIIGAIRQDSEKRYIEKLSAKIQAFQDYTHLTMAPYITDDELLRLDGYIKCYAREESLPQDILPLKPKRLINLDMYHFGWNMSHYFGFQKQNVATWLQEVFWDLRETKLPDITKKLHDSTKNEYNIPIIKDIPEYLRGRKS